MSWGPFSRRRPRPLPAGNYELEKVKLHFHPAHHTVTLTAQVKSSQNTRVRVVLSRLHVAYLKGFFRE